ncbi:MAG: right-handed parallel beta-helix repeat-containing protein [Promethearchaeia archaeon]
MINSIKKKALLFSVCLLLPTLLVMGSFQTNQISPNETGNPSPKTAGYYPDADPIKIKGDWSYALSQDWCTGNGTESDPYIIENLTISDTVKDGIFISNTKEYFIIRNVTVFNSSDTEYEAGIRLLNCSNGIITNNNLSNNNNFGINLIQSTNINVSNNIVNKNSNMGIYLHTSSDNKILSNEANENGERGISAYQSDEITIKDNTVKKNRYGMLILASDDNEILSNTIESNKWGIYLKKSDNNQVTGNSFKDNEYCIYEVDCEGNTYSDNGGCTVQRPGDFDLVEFISSPFGIIMSIGIIGAVIVVVVVIARGGAYKASQKERERIQKIFDEDIEE